MPVAIRAERLFDGLGVFSRPLVLIAGGRIEDVDFTGAAPPQGYDLIDLGEATLLPGLIDTHIHLTFDASTDPVGHIVAVDDEFLYEEAQLAGLRALRAGVTCVRDLGDRSYLGIRLGAANLAQPGLGPEVIAAGPPITTPSGHCWFLGGGVSGVDEIRNAVRDRAHRGARIIKVMVTGGLMTSGTAPDQCQFTIDELLAASDEAHRLGLPITGHAHGRDGIVAAMDAGFDGVEHATFRTKHGVEPDQAVIDRLAAAQTFVSIFMPGTVPRVPLPPVAESIMDQAVELFQRFVDAGVRIVIGSDAGIGPHKPHDVLPYAITHMTKVMTNTAVLSAATYHAAAACHVGDRKGRIARDFDADLVAVAGDPIKDVDAIHHRVAVFHKGHRIQPSPPRYHSAPPAQTTGSVASWAR